MRLQGKKESLKIEKEKFAGEQKVADLINLTDVYLFHCLVFHMQPLSTHLHLLLLLPTLCKMRRDGEDEDEKGGRKVEVETGRKME